LSDEGRTPEGRRSRTSHRALSILLAVLLASCTKTTPEVEPCPINVTEIEAQFPVWGRPTSAKHLTAYYEFPLKAIEHASAPVHFPLFFQLFWSTWKTRPTIPDPSPDEVRNAIAEGLNIGFLLDGIDERELIVTQLEKQRFDDYTRRVFLFGDPYVGTFRVVMLAPDSYPNIGGCIIALHGHGGSADAILSTVGEELVSEGYLLIAPDMRAMRNWTLEQDITLHLKYWGFELMGIRVYEALLTYKYLRYLFCIDGFGADAPKLGFIAHSGGTTVAALTRYLIDDAVALVHDHEVCVLNGEGVADRLVTYYGESIPQLYSYSAYLNRDEPKVLKTAYGHDVLASRMERIKKHFRRYLR